MASHVAYDQSRDVCCVVYDSVCGVYDEFDLPVDVCHRSRAVDLNTFIFKILRNEY